MACNATLSECSSDSRPSIAVLIGFVVLIFVVLCAAWTALERSNDRGLTKELADLVATQLASRTESFGSEEVNPAAFDDDDR